MSGPAKILRSCKVCGRIWRRIFHHAPTKPPERASAVDSTGTRLRSFMLTKQLFSTDVFSQHRDNSGNKKAIVKQLSDHALYRRQSRSSGMSRAENKTGGRPSIMRHQISNQRSSHQLSLLKHVWFSRLHHRSHWLHWRSNRPTYPGSWLQGQIERSP